MDLVKRNKSILEMRSKRFTFQEIGKKFNLTKERVRQIEIYLTKRTTRKGGQLLKPKLIGTGREHTREKARIRDKHTCQDCGKKWIKNKRKFDVHHLNKQCGKKSRGYDKVSEIKGLVTLCHKCHFNRPEHASRKLSLPIS
jgi:hypothetical protein